MEALQESFVFYPVERFDINGKQLLKMNNKWFIVDLGLRNHILPKKQYDLGFSLENIVFFELLRRGYKVNVGKNGDTEVDFVAQKDGVLQYYQVTTDITDEHTFDREIRPLRTIKDNYEKIILTLDYMTIGDYEGIKVINIIDWLLKNIQKRKNRKNLIFNDEKEKKSMNAAIQKLIANETEELNQKITAQSNRINEQSKQINELTNQIAALKQQLANATEKTKQ